MNYIIEKSNNCLFENEIDRSAPAADMKNRQPGCFCIKEFRLFLV